jgi:hypothetical protein
MIKKHKKVLVLQSTPSSNEKEFSSFVHTGLADASFDCVCDFKLELSEG